MRWAFAGAVLAVLFGSAPPAPAQFFYGRGGAGFSTSTNFSYRGGGLSYSYSYHSFYIQRYAFGYGLPGYLGRPGFYGFAAPYCAPRVIAPPIVFVQPAPVFVAAADPLLPANINPNDFIVIRPRNQQQGAPVDPVARRDPPAPRAARREVDLGVQPGALPVEAPIAANPRVEGARQQQMGKDAFDAGQYGRAIDRFEQAANVTPKDALVHFHLAQARFAVGKYREAVAAIADGMKLRPDWPGARFLPRDLYGNNVGLFDDHLQALKQAVEAAPNDPTLLFLLGYELWFDGQRGEARKMFERALQRTADSALIEAFLADGDRMVRQ